MDTTLSTCAFTFSIPKSNLFNHHNYHLLSTSTSSSTSSSKPKTTKLISSSKSKSKSSSSHGQNHLPPAPHIKHYSLHRPSTGYAVALLDAARRHNALEAVSRDVRRVLAMGDDDNEIVVKEVMKQGRFDKHLVKLVKLLIQKCKVDLVSQVLSEFRKMYHQLLLNQPQLDP